MKTPVPIYGLVRWSSDEQSLGDSESRQRADIQKYADELIAAGEATHLEFLPPDIQSARDGANLEVGSAGDFLRSIQSKKRRPGILLVAEPTRLSRAGLWKTINFVSALIVAGNPIGIASKRYLMREGDRDSLMRALEFQFEQQGGHQQNESRVDYILGEVGRRRQSVLESAVVINPDGSTTTTVYSARLPDWLATDPAPRKMAGSKARTIRVVPGRGELVQEMFKLSANLLPGGGGSINIAHLFNDRWQAGQEKYRPWRGDAWMPSKVANILGDDAVKGWWQPYRTEKRPGGLINPNTKHKRAPIMRIPEGERKRILPVVISEDLWDRSQAAKALRAKIQSGRPTLERQHVNLWSGQTFCGLCGGSMYLIGSNLRGKNDYVLCTNAQRKKTCLNIMHYSITRIERAMMAEGYNWILSAQDFSRPTKSADEIAARIDEAKRSLGVLIIGRDNLLASLRGESDTDLQSLIKSDLRTTLTQIKNKQSKISLIERELENLRGEKQDDIVRQAQFLINEVAAGYDETRAQLHALNKSIISKVLCHDGKVTVTSARLGGNVIHIEFTHYKGRQQVPTDAERVYVA